MPQLLGIVDLYWKGQKIDVKPGTNVELGGVTNKAQPYGRRIGRSQSMMESKITVKAIIPKGMVVTDLFKSDDEGELQVHCDTGQKFVWPDAFIEGTIKITSGDSSEADVNFAGGVPVEIV